MDRKERELWGFLNSQVDSLLESPENWSLPSQLAVTETYLKLKMFHRMTQEVAQRLCSKNS